MSFTYKISGVPDLDQQWRTLPNQGKCHCLPTAATTWMYYLAKHGRPHTLVYQDTNTSHSASVVANISRMAAYMDTDPVDGTGRDDGVDGLEDYLDDRSVPAFIRGESARDGANITFSDIELLAQHSSLVIPIIGRFEKDGDEFSRKSGHALALVGLNHEGDSATITVHNPNDNAKNIDTQSATVGQTETLKAETRNIEGEVVKVLRWGTDTDPFCFIEGFISIQPQFVLTNATASVVTRQRADLKSAALEKTDFPLPFSGELLDLAIHPFLPRASMIGRGSDDIWSLDLVSGTWTKQGHLSSPQRLTYGGRDHRLYVANAREVVALHDGKRTGSVTASDTIEAISYDAKGDRLLAAVSSGKHLLAVSRDLQVVGDTQAPVVSGSGRLALSVNRRDGTIVLSRSGSSQASTLRWRSGGALGSGSFHFLGDAPGSAAQVGAKGQLHLNQQERLATFDSYGNRSRSVFDGLPAGTLVKFARGGHNYDPERSRRREWKDR